MSKKILAIETSCDETAIAIVGCNKIKFSILFEAVASQIKTHRSYGGVVPQLAKREHIKNLPVLFDSIRKQFKINSIAVTVGPGLEPCLWTGINFANDLAKKMDLPIVGINHLEGHIYSNWLNHKNKIKFPAVVLIVSGGHTILLQMKKWSPSLKASANQWKKLGETRDDAAGEAFDKVAKMLKLPYPGGPEVEKLALKGNLNAIQFPRPMINAKNYDFSFSGLKTAVLYYLRDNPKFKKNDVCSSFQKAAIDVLTAKTIRAAKEFQAKSILLCGGVACNQALRKRLEEESKKIKAKFYAPEMKYNMDNAVMIAAAACLGKHYKANKTLPNLNL